MKSELEESKNKSMKLENVYKHPEYQKIELNYVVGQQKIAQALTFIESIPLKKEIKDMLVNTLASNKN